MPLPGIRSLSLRLLGVILLLLSACSGSDTGVGPDPTPSGPPLIRLFVVNQEDVVHGTWTQIQWRIEGAANATVLPDIGALRPLETGARSIRPIEDVTYTLTASNAHGTSTATARVTVTFRNGIYVNPLGGNDTNSGGTPSEPLATLAEAMNRTQGGGTLFLAAGDYATPLLIDGARRLIYGGLNPATFLQEEGYESWIRPAAGTPLVVRGPTDQTSLMDHLSFDARSGGTYAVEVDDAPLILQDCLVDGSWSSSGTGLRVSGTERVTLDRCRVRGGGELPGSPTPDESRAILVEGSAELQVRHCFLGGGVAVVRASGVDVNTSGSVLLALNTISAGLKNSGAAQDAASIRIRQGNPAIGGNILFTRGSGKRPAVIEEAADADPSWFEVNLLVGVSSPAYDNHSTDGADAQDDTGLNSYQVIIGNDGAGHVHGNRLQLAVVPTDFFEDVSRTDYHLLQPMRSGGGANPAVNSLSVFDTAKYGFGVRPVDIDGDVRPNSFAEYDAGADEL